MSSQFFLVCVPENLVLSRISPLGPYKHFKFSRFVVVVINKILGPPTFLVLIDDLNVDCLLHKYVDDATLTELLQNNREPSNVQSFLQQLLNWASSNDMVVNFNKTKEMIMGPASKTANLLPLSTETGSVERLNKLIRLNYWDFTHMQTSIGIPKCRPF